jgi:heptosyltransferase III
LRNPKKILLIIQRSNGDVFHSVSLIKAIYDFFNSPQIDLLVNDDTLQIASLIPHINSIHTFSYKKKSEGRWFQERELITKLIKSFDLSISLTSSDRSVIYALLFGRKSISVVEKDNKKSWWKKKLLTKYYFYDSTKHIVHQNLIPLEILDIKRDYVQKPINISNNIKKSTIRRLKEKGIEEFIIFHPSAQYKYKIMSKSLRDELLFQLSNIGIPIIITGTKNKIDLEIKNELPQLENVFDFIGETSLEEYFALSDLSLAYVGMDTLNMHIAASQNKRIFAIFGPTNLKIWSPWSNKIKTAARIDMPFQAYSNVSIFQSNMPCVACGQAGCNNSGKSECLESININKIFEEVTCWIEKNVEL